MQRGRYPAASAFPLGVRPFFPRARRKPNPGRLRHGARRPDHLPPHCPSGRIAMDRHTIMQYPLGSGLRFFEYSEGLTPSSHGTRYPLGPGLRFLGRSEGLTPSSHGTRYPLGPGLRFLGHSEGLTPSSSVTEHAGQRVAPPVTQPSNTPRSSPL